MKITVADSTKITIEGIDKHLVGQTAADIRSFYPPEPYKGRASAMSESRFVARAKLSSKPCLHPPANVGSVINGFEKVTGTPERPRLAVHFSERHITAQVIDDSGQDTRLCPHDRARASLGKEGALGRAHGREGRQADRGAVSSKVKKVVFDRGGYQYHGKVKALADAAREAAWNFKIIYAHSTQISFQVQ